MDYFKLKMTFKNKEYFSVPDFSPVPVTSSILNDEYCVLLRAWEFLFRDTHAQRVRLAWSSSSRLPSVLSGPCLLQ